MDPRDVDRTPRWPSYAEALKRRKEERNRWLQKISTRNRRNHR